MSEKTYSNDEVQLVAFKLGKEEYGVSILHVQEIKRLTDITRVPYTPGFIKGVMNLRGSVLPVIDLKKRLGLFEEPYSEDTRIIIVKVDDISIGMIVDAVTEVLSIAPEHIEEPEAVVDGNGNNFISGVGNLDNRLVIMLNLNEIIGLTGETK
ncbi:chemotaxis protein CheW [Anaerosinus sp.]|uniref:chemotaxis protein CheW n=1 Tax=Selenobaculum sp. TaxID=3074374 RepID=UPI0015AE8368